MLDVTHERMPTNGIHLEVAVAGPEDGTPIFLLHGFPESWYCWRFQIPALAAAGYRVYAPNLRGYGGSDKPRGVRHYGIDDLADDIAGLLDHLGLESAAIAGHDWGGAIVWHFGARHPSRAKGLCVMNCPPAAVVRKTIFSSLAQARKSWYIFVFQLPWLPEWMLSTNNYARPWAAMAKMATHRDKFTEADRAIYMEAWTQPYAVTAMLNYYRAVLRVPPKQRSAEPIEAPMTLIWGTADHALNEAMIEPTRAYARDLEVHRLEGISHWVNVDAADRVNDLLIAWLRKLESTPE